MTTPRPTAPLATTKLATRLHSLAIHLLRRVRREDAAAGMSPARLSALSVLVFGGPRTIGDLAAVEQVRPPTMTRLVAGLEAGGFVVREPDATDGRVVRVRATDRGRRVMEEGRQRRVARVIQLLEPLPASDRATIARAVHLLEAALAGAATATEPAPGTAESLRPTYAERSGESTRPGAAD